MRDLNSLPFYGMPQSHTTMDRAELREFLKSTGGWIFVQGERRNIKSKSLGAGVYDVWTVADDGGARG